MTDPARANAATDSGSASDTLARTEGRSAGAILRAAREAQGLHIAVLAATIKVSPQKLEALEQDRHDELSNVSFVRALAQSVCRSLKIDPRPVLALLPMPDNSALERPVGNLNAPFRDRPGRGEMNLHTNASRPALWAGAALLVGAAVVYFLPSQWLVPSPAILSERDTPPQPAPAVTLPQAVPPAPAADPSALLEGARVAPPAVLQAASAVAPPPVASAAGPSLAGAAVTGASSPAASAAASGPKSVLQFQANAETWVEVVDADGKTLLSRTLGSGESVGVDGAFPMRLKVGNAAGLQVALRGKAVELTPYTRDNVARLELR